MVADIVSRKTIATLCYQRNGMVTRARGRFINRPTRTGRGTYDKFFIYVPTELARDSNFPVRPGQEVEVWVDQEKGVLVVQPVDGRKRREKTS